MPSELRVPENLLESLDLESDFDGDSCDIKTLKTMFSGQYELEAETSVSMSRCFVLHISGSVSSNSKIVAALSNYSCTVYDVPHLTKLDTTSEHKGPVSGINRSLLNTDPHALSIAPNTKQGVILLPKLADLNIPPARKVHQSHRARSSTGCKLHEIYANLSRVATQHT
uniref:Uncharacterized protein n=1 Tax=Timema douglasi TaxID=61478 RepID=A0A7R8VMA7_TIMDO|nr:unnamed protein product [Timema douglasi]